MTNCKERAIRLTAKGRRLLAAHDQRETLLQLQEQVQGASRRQLHLGPESIRELRADSCPLGAADCFESEVAS